ncbi:zinc ribbon domain-containing protein [Arthrobacter sp. M2012083]|uniref:zinc ribbon domain-containing protein n=1 Tax=Arthrobacter sp. M2012083 TaxID=1197706 RepID=UPI00037CE980|nr:zinc ribbon domain-containing protein [Arthrobacter sp. M2012083]
MSAAIQKCLSCGNLFFPARLFCPECGRENFSTELVEHADVAETTRLADGTLLATLRIPGGPSVVGRVTGGPASSGDRLPLANNLSTTRGVYAYLPDPSQTSGQQP